MILDECLKAANEIKDLELHFSMGEAIVYASLGPRSPKGRDPWQVEENDFIPIGGGGGLADNSEDHVKWILDQLCGTYMLSEHPNVKQASCMWLLAIVKHGRDLPAVKERLLDVQSAFMGLLGDSNDLIQDAASKGLGLVYDSCTEKQQAQMVKSLLNTLMEGRKEVQKVSWESVCLFEGCLIRFAL
jgi:proteasome component ECM29